MTDYIDRSKIGLTDFETVMCQGNYKEALKMLLEKIENLPAANVREDTRGVWIPIPCEIEHANLFACSKCKWQVFIHEDYNLNYCSHCGARMDGDR